MMTKMQNIKNHISKNILFYSLVIIYIPLFDYFKILNKNGGHNFMTADWLINYEYGYLNRGLIGTFIIHLFDNSTDLLNFITYLLIFLYIFIFYFVNKNFQKSSEKLVALSLILSPAGFLFHIYDSQGSFRKELIGILGLFVLLSSIQTSKFNKYLWISSIILFIGIFSHSVNLFLVPTILLILFKYQKTRKIFDYLLFLIPSLIFLILNLFFRQTEEKLFEIKNNLCSDMFDIGLENICGYGSFDFITWDMNAHYVVTQNYVINTNRDNYYIYILFFFFSIIPFMFEKKILNFSIDFLFIGTAFIPLFLIAIDWGRWIYLITICYLAIYLLNEKKVVDSNLKYVLLVYPFMFRMEHCCNTYFEFSPTYLFNNFKYIFSNFTNLFSIF